MILLILSVPSNSQTDWSLPLKLCWSIDESVTRVASDNDSKNIILFSVNSIKSINSNNGQILWENKYDSEKFSDIFFIKNNLYFSEINNKNNKKYFHSIDVYSGLSIWRIEILNTAMIFLNRNENKILIEDVNLERFYLSTETGQKLKSNISLSNIFEISPIDGKFSPYFYTINFRLTFQGKIILESLDIIKKNIQAVIPTNEKTFIWSTNDDFIGIYNFISKKNIWLRKIGGQITDIKVFGNTIYVSSFDNFVYLVNAINGKFLLKKRLDGRVTNSSEVFENRVATSAYSSKIITIFNLKNNKVENYLSLSDAQGFAIYQSFIEDKLIVATPFKVLAFSPNCK